MNGAKMFVCISCRAGEASDGRPGVQFIDALRERAAERGVTLAIEPVESLAVCKRPTTIALAAPDKWTYVIGDLDTDADLDGTIDGAIGYARSENGVVPWKERPACFKKGVVSRIPPVARGG